MLSEVRRVGILRAGVVGAILYGFFGVIFLPFAVIALIADPAEGFFLALMVVFYPLMGFLGCILFAALYNLAAKLGGGFLLELEQVINRRDPVTPGGVSGISV